MWSNIYFFGFVYSLVQCGFVLLFIIPLWINKFFKVFRNIRKKKEKKKNAPSKMWKKKEDDSSRTWKKIFKEFFLPKLFSFFLHQTINLLQNWWPKYFVFSTLNLLLWSFVKNTSSQTNVLLLLGFKHLSLSLTS